MQKKRQVTCLWLWLTPYLALFGATPRAKDGFLSFVVVLGFLGLVLGILYLVDYVKVLIKRFTESNGDELVQ